MVLSSENFGFSPPYAVMAGIGPAKAQKFLPWMFFIPPAQNVKETMKSFCGKQREKKRNSTDITRHTHKLPDHRNLSTVTKILFP